MKNFEILSTEELLNIKGGKKTKPNKKEEKEEKEPKRANREFEMRKVYFLDDCYF